MHSDRARGRATPAPISVGLSVALTGVFALQGRQAFQGLQLWASELNHAGGVRLGARRQPVRLVVYDDASQVATARANTERLLVTDRVALLVGPYASGLTLAAAQVAARHGRLLWNHGGTSDALFRQAGPHLVSIAGSASTYLASLPALLQQHAPRLHQLTALFDPRGTFAAAVLAGLTAAAPGAGLLVQPAPLPVPVADPLACLEASLPAVPEGLALIGRYPDEVALVRACRARARQPEVVVAVAAGLTRFGPTLGPLAEGVIGPSQWEPGLQSAPRVGPTAERFVAAFQAACGVWPEYPAAQAYALGWILTHCLEVAGTLDEGALRTVAEALDTTTLFGRFRLEPGTGRQVGHRGVLVQWVAGGKRLLTEGA